MFSASLKILLVRLIVPFIPLHLAKLNNMDNLENWKSHSEQITDLSNKLLHLIETCCHNMGVDEYNVIEDKMTDLTNQGIFWQEQENPQRFLYDLKVFGMWLCDFIADKDREFWNEDS